MINRVGQKAGRQYQSSNIKANKNHFCLDISIAYPDNAKVEKWIRSYDWKKHEVVIKDNYILKETTGVNQISRNHVVLTVDNKQVQLYFACQL